MINFNNIVHIWKRALAKPRFHFVGRHPRDPRGEYFCVKKAIAEKRKKIKNVKCRIYKKVCKKWHETRKRNKKRNRKSPNYLRF